MSERMTDVEAFTLGAKVAVAAIRKGVSVGALPILLKAEAEGLLDEAQADSDPLLLATKLHAAAPAEMRADPDSQKRTTSAGSGGKSVFDSVREDQTKKGESLNKGTSAADRLTQGGAFG